jgi:hypothetical protein
VSERNILLVSTSDSYLGSILGLAANCLHHCFPARVPQSSSAENNEYIKFYTVNSVHY